MNISNNFKLIIIFVASLLILIMGAMLTNATEEYANIWLGVLYFAIWMTLLAFIYQNMIKDYFYHKKENLPPIQKDIFVSPSDETYKTLPLRERVSTYVDERRGLTGIKETKAHLKPTSYQRKTDLSAISSFHNEPELPELPNIEGSDIENISFSNDVLDENEIELLDIEETGENTQSLIQELDSEDLPGLTDIELIDDDLVISSPIDDIDTTSLPDDILSPDFLSSEDENSDVPGEMELPDFNNLSIQDPGDSLEYSDDIPYTDPDGIYVDDTILNISDEDEENRSIELLPTSSENTPKKNGTQMIDLPYIDEELDSELNPDDFFDDEELDDIDLSEDPDL